MSTLLAIALAGAVGSVARYLLGRGVQRLAAVAFPIGTLVVNVTGCLIIGLVARHFLNDETRPVLQASLIVGFCGGFTTFSAFSFETFGLIQAGNWPKAVAYMVASVLLCLGGTALGYQLGARLG